MEKLMNVLAVLFEQWWWSCPVDVWEQILMLSAAILGGIDSGAPQKGKSKGRDDETKSAAAQCLWSVLRQRSEVDTDSPLGHRSVSNATARFAEFQARGHLPKLLPVLGQTLTSLLDTSQSVHRGLQAISLRLIYALITDYFPDAFLPSILPGVVSTMAKVSLGHREAKGWSSGDTVDRALAVMQATIIGAIGDEICEAEGALRTVSRLEDLGNTFKVDGESCSVTSSPHLPSSPLFTRRTSVWLSASASQLHMAINTLSPLLSHPHPVALLSLSRFSHALLYGTNQTLPDTQPLLLSFLLSLSINPFPNIADTSHDHLLTILRPPFPGRFTLLQILLRTTRDNLSSLTHLIPSHSDAKVEHLARQISAACRLASHVHTVSDGVGKLLGPTGGIEKWGWSLLSVLELTTPLLFVSTVQPPQALLEGSSPESASSHPFPEINMKYVSSKTTREALDGMFRALGTAAGPECLFAVEWFVGVARRGKGMREIAALWCAGRILEGVCGISLERPDGLRQPVTQRVGKAARWTAKIVAEFWHREEEADELPREEASPVDSQENDAHLPLEYVKGLNPLVTRFDTNGRDHSTRLSSQSEHVLHALLALQLLAVTAAILQSQFMRLLLYTLYPVLHSLVSDNAYLSSTALAALHYITYSTGYATPSNLLLANFDYVLDAVAWRLDRRHLDPQATRILVVLVRLVGKDVVLRAGDLVEACFDRLDEFHGYEILVEGLVEVLAEVIKAVEAEDEDEDVSSKKENEDHSKEPEDQVESFLHWYQHRHDPPEEDQEDYGPAPREAWAGLGKGKEKEVAEDEQPEASKPTDDEDPAPPTPTQILTGQIVSRSVYFLTHPSPLIRARILGLLDTACPILSETALLPSIHSAWPYILNRLGDSEPFVVNAAASLVASLSEQVGEFMTTRIWKDVWPRFRAILSKLEEADSQSALARRGRGAVGTESAYSHSHRLYKALLRTMRAVVKGVELRSHVAWEVTLAFRRFLHIRAHEELQLLARELYVALMEDNGDTVWLMLCASVGGDVGSPEADFRSLAFLRAEQWDIEANARLILQTV